MISPSHFLLFCRFLVWRKTFLKKTHCKSQELHICIIKIQLFDRNKDFIIKGKATGSSSDWNHFVRGDRRTYTSNWMGTQHKCLKVFVSFKHWSFACSPFSYETKCLGVYFEITQKVGPINVCTEILSTFSWTHLGASPWIGAPLTSDKSLNLW